MYIYRTSEHRRFPVQYLENRLQQLLRGPARDIETVHQRSVLIIIQTNRIDRIGVCRF